MGKALFKKLDYYDEPDSGSSSGFLPLPTKPSGSVCFLDALHMATYHRNRSDSLHAHSANSHLPILASKECSGLAYHSKTDVVVAVVGVVVVATRGAAIPRIVVPRTAAFGCLPHLKILCLLCFCTLFCIEAATVCDGGIHSLKNGFIENMSPQSVRVAVH